MEYSRTDVNSTAWQRRETSQCNSVRVGNECHRPADIIMICQPRRLQVLQTASHRRHLLHTHTHTHTHRFTALCLGLPGWVSTRRDICPHTPVGVVIILDFMRCGEDNRGNCTDNPAARHPIWTIDAPICIIPSNFTQDALPAATLPIYPGLGQASNMRDCIPGGLYSTTDKKNHTASVTF